MLVKTWAGDTAPWMVYGLYQEGGTQGKVGYILSVDKGNEKRLHTVHPSRVKNGLM